MFTVVHSGLHWRCCFVCFVVLSVCGVSSDVIYARTHRRGDALVPRLFTVQTLLAVYFPLRRPYPPRSQRLLLCENNASTRALQTQFTSVLPLTYVGRGLPGRLDGKLYLETTNRTPTEANTENQPEASPCPPCREAQRSAVQLLSSLSRQFQSDEMHIVFEEGVHLTWGAAPLEEPVLGRPKEGGCRRPPEAGTGGSGGTREGLMPGLSSGFSFSETGAAPHVGAAAAATASGSASGQRGGSGSGLSLTRFLSNVVVACSQASRVRILLRVDLLGWRCCGAICGALLLLNFETGSGAPASMLWFGG